MEKNTKSLKAYTLDEVTDKYIGKRGTPKRELFESELHLELLGDSIRKIRHERNLTQAQLGEIVGVQKAQISKIESSLTNAKFDTILKVFAALNAKISFKVEILNQKVEVTSSSKDLVFQ